MVNFGKKWLLGGGPLCIDISICLSFSWSLFQESEVTMQAHSAPLGVGILCFHCDTVFHVVSEQPVHCALQFQESQSPNRISGRRAFRSKQL